MTTVGNEADLIAAIDNANAAAPGTALAPIVLENDIAIATPLPALSLASGVTLTIESAAGQDYAIKGGGTQQGLAILSGDVTLNSIRLTDDLAAGANGSVGNGGGAGLGGALFVGSGAIVTLDDVGFANDRAVGGKGGTGNAGALGTGGNNGLGGFGGQGGIAGATANAPRSTGHFGGGGGGGTGGNGGRGFLKTTIPFTNPTMIGGTPVIIPGTTGTAGVAGGQGGFGGGAGGHGGHGAKSQGTVGGTGGQGGGGGGGLGAGGDIFVQSGGKLLIEGGNLSGGSATGGLGGAGGNPGSKGAGYGAGIFMQGTSVLVFDPTAAQSVVVDDAIADMAGSDATYAGALTLDMNGAGALTLNNSGNSFTGGVDLDDGTLTLEVAGAAGSGDIVFGVGVGHAATLALADSAFANKIDNLGAGDVIDLTGLQYTGAAPYTALAVGVGGQLSVTEGGKTETFTLGSPEQQTFYAMSDGAAGTLISAACYRAGTRILCETGEVAIEALSVGDLVVTASGARRPVVWLGHRRIEIARHRDGGAVRPVRVEAGAFGGGLPRRDLWLSPDHNVACEGALIPIKHLINGRSVAQIAVDRVEYRHVELDAHDVIFAEGLPAESYLDTGNRAAFSNGGDFLEAHPDFAPRHWAQTCLPLALEGAPVVAAKARLLAVLAERGCALDAEADAHVCVDGVRVEPLRLSPSRMAFLLPSGGADIVLRSKVFVPAHALAGSSDMRFLGLCVGALQIDGAPFALHDEAACGAGWDRPEQQDGRFSHRWTRGAAMLPGGARVVIVDLAGEGRYWAAPGASSAAFA